MNSTQIFSRCLPGLPITGTIRWTSDIQDENNPEWRPTVHLSDGLSRPATDDECRAIKIEQYAERILDREVWCVDSSLVDELMNLSNQEGDSDLAKEFVWDNVSNLTPDPSEWTIEQCRGLLEDEGHELPEPNPWKMTREELADELGHDSSGDETPEAEAMQQELIENINDETVNYLEEWRDAVRDNAQPAEGFEWWRISKWMAGQLNAIGQCVLGNDFGYWWWRCTTGQEIMLDGVLQEIAARHIQ